jgi:hypothetical protein
MLRKALILLGLTLGLAACERMATDPADRLAGEEAAPRAQTAGEEGLTRSAWPSAEDPGPPFYARIEPAPPHIYTVDGWAVIQFYRDPACIRGSFNLLALFDAPAAFGCPLVVEGFSLWEGQPFSSGAPKITEAQGTGAVPFWFIPADAVSDAMTDGVLTIGELAALPGRLTGVATEFSEALHPGAPPLAGGGHRNPVFSQSARGTLEDGRTFEYHVTKVHEELRTIELHFE